MNRDGRQMTYQARRAWTLLCVCAMALAFLIFSYPGRAQQQQAQQDSRPRRVNPASSPTPTPTPTPNTAKTPNSTTPPRLNGPPPAQAPGTEAPSPSPDDPGGVEIDPNDTIKVDTNLVNLNVRVINRDNRTVNDVRQDEFRVYEDGVQQKIEFASKEEVPISYGLAIDTSGSLRPQIVKVIEAGKTVINSNKPGDETFLMRFISKEKMDLAQDFTADKGLLIEVLEDFFPEGGQTAVIDAVYLAAEHVAEYKRGSDLEDRRRRALIVVTDGEDRDSFYTQEQLFQQLREEDVQIFVIGFVNELDDEKKGVFIRKSPKSKAVNLINKLAEETGGRAFFPNSLTELPGIAEEITRDMRTQYVIGYYPTNDRRDGTYRAIRVAIGDSQSREKRIAITRPGRTAPREGGSTNAPPQPAAPATRNNIKPGTGGRKP